MSRATVRICRHLDDLGAFLPDPLYLELAENLGVTEWNPVVWIGRIFLLDNDFGEHRLDNWEEREARAEAARALDLDPDDLLILRPERFQDGRDGPRHTDDVRRRFWTNVLRSLELSLGTIADEARSVNAVNKEHFPEEHRPDLEARVERWRERLTAST